mmetsp:Transcript_3010/g.8687  ORF Transcript_3010/g.8687 Transcript_3010/m.8687 type:complete len:244 (+) Transcript_3010:733-1464(+)
MIRVQDVFDENTIVDGQIPDRRRPLERRVVHLRDARRRRGAVGVAAGGGAGKEPQQALFHAARDRRRTEGRRRAALALGHGLALAARVEAPAVVGALDVALSRESALGERREAVRALVLQGERFAFAAIHHAVVHVEERHLSHGVDGQVARPRDGIPVIHPVEPRVVRRAARRLSGCGMFGRRVGGRNSSFRAHGSRARRRVRQRRGHRGDVPGRDVVPGAAAQCRGHGWTGCASHEGRRCPS